MLQINLNKVQTKLIDLNFEKQSWDFVYDESYHILLMYPVSHRNIVYNLIAEYLQIECMPCIETLIDGTQIFSYNRDCSKFNIENYLAFKKEFQKIA